MKLKKTDLKYGDVIQFESSTSFGHVLAGRSAGFTEDTFLVDLLRPKRGKVKPGLELRSASQPGKICQVRGPWPRFEVLARLPDNVQVFKTGIKNFGGPMHFRTSVTGPDGLTWDDKTLVA